MNTIRFAAMTTMALAAGAAWAQSGSDIKPARAWSLDVRGSFFRNAEDRTYMSMDLGFGLVPRWEVGLRGAFASVSFAKAPAAIRTGGSDLEVYVRHSPEQCEKLSLLAGISLPNTPAQNQAFGTFGASYKLATPDFGPTVSIGARGVLRQDSSIMGLSAGLNYSFGPGWEMFGDITGIVHGDNTRDTGTGAAMRRALWGAGLRYNFKSFGEAGVDGSIYMMVTNALGMTTGTSLSPGLGDRPALAIGFSIRGRS